MNVLLAYIGIHNRGISAAFVSCFLLPGNYYYTTWQRVSFGLASVGVNAVYPIHQTVGQINGTLYMALRVRVYETDGSRSGQYSCVICVDFAWSRLG
jgi:hypothetical protein